MTAPDPRWKRSLCLGRNPAPPSRSRGAVSHKAQSLLKHFLNIFVRHGLCESFWGRDGKTPFDLQGFLLGKSEVRQGSGPWKQQIADRIVAGIATSALGSEADIRAATAFSLLCAISRRPVPPTMLPSSLAVRAPLREGNGGTT